MKQARKVDCGKRRRGRAKRRGRKVREGRSQPGQPGKGPWHEAREPTPALQSIEVAKRDQTPRKALGGRPGEGRKTGARNGTTGRRSNGTLKEQESSREDEPRPEKVEERRAGKPRDRPETVESKRTGSTRKDPTLFAYKTPRSHELHECWHEPRRLDRATFDRAGTFEGARAR